MEGAYFMLTRREFLHISSGVAAGAVLAGLGLSISPRDADAVVVVDDAILGSGALILLGLLGVALGFKTYTDLQNGVPAAVGNSLRRYASDSSNESAIVGLAASQAQGVLGAVYTESQLQETFQSGEWLDGLVNSITSTGSNALDWLNARTAEAAVAWGTLKAWTGTLSPDYVTSYVQGVQCGAVSPMNFMTMMGAPAEQTSTYNPPFDVKTSMCYFLPDASPVFSRVQVRCWNVAPTYVDSKPSDVLPDGLYVYPNSRGGLTCQYTGCQSYSWNGSRKSWSGSSTGQISFYLTGYGAATYHTFDSVSLTSVDPQIDGTIDTPQSIDPANWGFGVPVIGTDAVIGDDGLSNTGHLLSPGTLEELLRDGSLTLPWADLVYGGGVGLTDARVRGIEGDASIPLGYPIPLDVPVTVSVPVEGTGYGTQTMTLEDALATGADTSISRPVPLQATPFYPVNPPGTNASPPSTFPTIPFESFFPFNMLFSWLHWLGDNVR